MENYSFLLPQSKLKIKSKKTAIKKKLGSLSNNCYPYLCLDNRNKSLVEKKLFKTVFNTRKNSLLNSKNNSTSSTKNSKSKRFNSIHYISSSLKIKNIKKIKNSNNFNIDQIEIKGQEDWQLNPTLSKVSYNSNYNDKSTKKKEKGKNFKTENNQKLIFNNVGIHYHRAKNNNKIDSSKKESNNDQEINNLKNQIFILLKKNSILENEKKEKDNKIEILEEKLDKLLNFIKNKNSKEDNEKIKLKKENDELKKELENKNKIILTLTNNQIDNHSFNKKYISIGKKKEKNMKKYISNKISITGNNLDEADIKKIKLISIDPDNF